MRPDNAEAARRLARRAASPPIPRSPLFPPHPRAPPCFSRSPVRSDARGRQIMISSSLRAVFGTMKAKAQVSTRIPAASQ
ncbi:hypothetical protein GCM10009839_26850 [Catenulispora yoronensis]|uniref:Uncharacterized protein n=1 Tax=Catenulispora yoronensis TaxID=450799 RepID=A0ABN2U1J1_9ACTN